MRSLYHYAEAFRQFLNARDGGLKDKTLRSAVWVFFANATLYSLTFVRSIILARLLGPEIFGVMGVILFVVAGLEILTTTGFSAALIHRQKDVLRLTETAFSLNVIRGILLTLLLVALSAPIATFYENPSLSPTLKIIALSFMLSGLGNVNLILLEKNLDFRRIAYLEQVVGFISTIVVLSLAYYWRSVWVLVIAHVFTAILKTILSYIIIPGKPRFGFQIRLAADLFSYGKFITATTILIYMATEIDKAIIGKLLDMEALGFYVIAFMIANLPATHIGKVASRVLFPAYSKLQNKPEVLREAYVDVIRIVTAITAPITLGLMVLARPLIEVMYGHQWLPTAEPLIVLCIFGSLRALTQVNGYLFNGIGQPKLNFQVVTVRLALLSALIVPLALSYGLIGVAWAVTIPISVQLLIGIRALRKVLGISIASLSKAVAVNYGFAAIMAGTLLGLNVFIDEIGIVTLALEILCGATVYVLLNRGELRYLAKLITKNVGSPSNAQAV